MKIYILPIDKIFQPGSVPFRYPIYSKDYGMEQDFLIYLLKHQELRVSKPEESDWHYLPIFWTNWHINHDYAKTGLAELQREVKRVILDDKKTFTVSQYALGPLVDMGKTVLFLSSRQSEKGIDIPLLSPFYKEIDHLLNKKYLAGFIGSFKNHHIRKKMFKELSSRKDVYISDSSKLTRRAIAKLVCNEKRFVKNILESYLVLCPRGVGGDSFRFYDAMQLGVAPFLIGDIDTRPFKKFIDWNKISLYSNKVKGLNQLLDSFNNSDLLAMGKEAQVVWENQLCYQKWCPLVIKELKNVYD